jgi:alkylation response protein AidB-like acyl-CoA dehydrogenase
MNTTVLKLQTEDRTRDWVAIARTLGQEFGKRSAEYDRNGQFVTDNYRDLREYRFFSAGIPNELGGGGATYEELAACIRELGRHCGSTALAFAMHTHPVAVNVYKHMRGDEAATRTLRRIADNELIIAGTGANDWLESSGEAKRVDGGYRVSAHKRFVSGAPGAQVFVTSVSHVGPESTEVLHFAIPFSSEGVRLVETWNTLGIRARDVYCRATSGRRMAPAVERGSTDRPAADRVGLCGSGRSRDRFSHNSCKAPASRAGPSRWRDDGCPHDRTGGPGRYGASE